MKNPKHWLWSALALSLILSLASCTTKTAYIPNDVRAQAIAGFSQDDIYDTIYAAVDSLVTLDRIKAPEGSARAVVIVENVVNDTLSRGRDAEALAEGLGLSLREELTNSGKIVVYNREAAQYATVQVTPQYILKGRLTQRNLRQDNSDFQIEYSLNLTLIDLATGLEFWQKRIPLRKVAARKNAF